jgi:hypothetical protein
VAWRLLKCENISKGVLLYGLCQKYFSYVAMVSFIDGENKLE